MNDQAEDHATTTTAVESADARRDLRPPPPGSPTGRVPMPVQPLGTPDARPRGRWPVVLLVFVLLVIVAALGYWLWSRQQGSTSPAAEVRGAAAGARAVPVVAATARQGNLELYVDGLGNVNAFNTVTVRARVDGQIVNVAYQEGQLVKQGDLLVEIDPRPFQAALDQSQGQLARDQALLRNAQLDLERFQNARETVTQQQIDTQTALVHQYQGVVQSDQGAVENAKLQLSYCRVTAPIAGRAGLRMVDVGNMVRANDTAGLVVIAQVQPIAVVFSLAQNDLPRVLEKYNQGQPLKVDALDETLTRRFDSGTLTAIDNQVDPTTGTVRLKATFANEQNVLYPNEFVNARLYVDTLRDVVIVPTAAVQRGPSSASFVYVVGRDQTVQMRDVTTGPSEGEQTVIESGVSPGDVLVTDGVDKLQQGSRVTVGTGGAAAAATTRSARTTTGPTRSTTRPMTGAGPRAGHS